MTIALDMLPADELALVLRDRKPHKATAHYQIALSGWVDLVLALEHRFRVRHPGFDSPAFYLACGLLPDDRRPTG